MIRGTRMTDEEFRRFLYREYIQAEERVDAFLKELVSTIPDECKGVGPEIGTGSKQKAIER